MKLSNLQLASVKVTPSMKRTVQAAESSEWTPAQTAAGTALMLAEGLAVAIPLILTHF